MEAVARLALLVCSVWAAVLAQVVRAHALSSMQPSSEPPRRSPSVVGVVGGLDQQARVTGLMGQQAATRRLVPHRLALAVVEGLVLLGLPL